MSYQEFVLNFGHVLGTSMAPSTRQKINGIIKDIAKVQKVTPQTIKVRASADWANNRFTHNH
jgi:hypothetical protein